MTAKELLMLRSTENREYLEILCRDKGCDIDKLSDFELFAFVCDELSLMYGNKIKKNFLTTLSIGTVDFDLLKSREVQKTLWRRLNGADESRIDIAKSFNKKDRLIIARSQIKGNTVFLNALLNDAHGLPESLDVFIRNICDSGKNIGIDMNGFEYLRPDEYRTAQTYQKILSCDEYTRGEISALMSWIVCRVLMRKNAMLYIIPDSRAEQTEKLLTLLSARRLYPEAVVSVSNAAEVECAIKLCRSPIQKNISSEIVISEETDMSLLSGALERLAYELPSTRISINTEADEKYEELIKLTERLIQAREER